VKLRDPDGRILCFTVREPDDSRATADAEHHAQLNCTD
jgi:hypothetical protein